MNTFCELKSFNRFPPFFFNPASMHIDQICKQACACARTHIIPLTTLTLKKLAKLQYHNGRGENSRESLIVNNNGKSKQLDRYEQKEIDR